MKNKHVASPGRPKHVAEYKAGGDAQQSFSNAMRAILSGKKPEKKSRAAAGQ